MNYPHGEEGYAKERMADIVTHEDPCWLKPGRVSRPIPGVALTVLRTNGGDAQVAVSIDRQVFIEQN